MQCEINGRRVWNFVEPLVALCVNARFPGRKRPIAIENALKGVIEAA